MVAVGQARDQVPELMRRRRKAVQQQDRRTLRIARLAVEDRDVPDVGATQDDL
jgi:hypothetical protein